MSSSTRSLLLVILAVLFCAAAVSFVLYQQHHPSSPAGSGVTQMMSMSGKQKSEEINAEPANATSPSPQRKLKVRTIWSGSHQPAAETTVTLTMKSRVQGKAWQRQMLTNAQGEAQLTFPAFWKQVQVNAKNKHSIGASRDVDTTTTNSIVMALQPATIVFGTVRMESGALVAGAEVRNFGGNATTITKDDGTYELDGLRGGAQARIFAQKGNLTSRVINQPALDIADAPRSGPVDLVLKPGCSLRGTVKNKAGDPVPGLQLFFSAQVMTPTMPQKTNANGEYRLAALPAGEVQVGVMRDNQPLTSERCRLELNKDNVLDFVLPEQTTIFGTVMGPDKAPVPGAEISIAQNSGWGMSALSDERGQYEISGEFGEKSRFQAHTDTLVAKPDQKIDTAKLKKGERNGPIDIAMIQGLTLKGKVTAAATSQPVKQAHVYLNDQQVSREVVTKDDGQYEIAGLPEAKMYYTVSAEKFASKNKEIEIKADKPNILDIQLEQEAIVFGHVYDSNKTPVARAKVSTSPFGGSQVSTKDDGSYEISNLAAGKITLFANKGDLVSSYSQKEGETFEVKAGERSGPHDLYLKEGLKVEGLVNDAETQQPIANAKVSLYGREPKNIKTDSSGRFVLTGLMSGRINFDVSAENYITNRNALANVSPDSTEPVIISLKPAITVFGHVYIEKQGAPAAKANVTITPLDSNLSNGTQASSDGSYEIQVPVCENVRISARLSPYISAYTPDQEKTFALKAGQRNGPFDLILVRGLSVVGTFTDKDSKIPLPGGKVRNPQDWQTWISCDTNGRYRVEGLMAQSLRLQGWAPDHVGIEQSVMPSQETDAVCDFALARGGEIEVHVSNPDNKPVAGANVWLNYNGPGQYIRLDNENIQTDLTGMALIKEINRDVTARLNVSSGNMSANSEVTFPPDQTRLVVNVALKKGQENPNQDQQDEGPGVVVGTVTDENGNGLSGITVKQRYEYNNIKPTSTDASGNYKLSSENYRSGSYLELMAAGPGYAAMTKNGKMGSEIEPGRIDFQLAKGHWLILSVVDSSKNPVPKASLNFYSNQSSRFGNSFGPPEHFQMDLQYKPNAQGKMRIESLPDGQVQINANTPEGRNGSIETLVDQEVQLVLRDVGVLHGQLIDAETGAPIPTFSLSNGGSDPTRYTNPRGEFVLERLPLDHPVQLSVQAEGYTATTLQATAQPSAKRNEIQVFKISKANLFSAVLTDAATNARLAGAAAYYLPGSTNMGNNVNWGWLEQNYNGMHVEKKTTGPDGAVIFQESEPRGLVLIKAAGYERKILKPEERKQNSPLEPMLIA